MPAFAGGVGAAYLLPNCDLISVAGSDLRVQIQIDPRYLDFPARAEVHDTLGQRCAWLR